MDGHIELERRFLIDAGMFLEGNGDAPSVEIEQAALRLPSGSSTRMRLVDRSQGIITFKHVKEDVLYEKEEEIDPEMCALFIRRSGLRKIEKTRYVVEACCSLPGLLWEVDVFHGDLEGLAVAEIELPYGLDVDVWLPRWIKKEITGDARLSNVAMQEAKPSDTFDVVRKHLAA